MPVHTLTRTPKSEPPPAVPKGVTRTWLDTPGGKLELLVSLPDGPTTKPPLLFLHGGFGSALCYRHFLPYFSSKSYPTYALSFRGHGASFKPGYWSMYFTSLATMVGEAAFAINHITEIHSTPPIVGGHSSGGGVLQALLSRDAAKVSGAILLGAVSGFGGFTTNLNWWLFDPWFYPRYFKDGCHPRSPLSSTDLVRQAFFSDEAPEEVVMKCEEHMPEFESMAWPMGMMTIFAHPELVARRVAEMKGTGLGNEGKGGKGMLLIAGELDRLVPPKIVGQLAKWYRGAAEWERVDARFEERLVQGSGHHIMLDVKWRDAAEILREWLEGEDSGKK